MTAYAALELTKLLLHALTNRLRQAKAQHEVVHRVRVVEQRHLEVAVSARDKADRDPRRSRPDLPAPRCSRRYFKNDGVPNRSHMPRPMRHWRTMCSIGCPMPNAAV